MMMRLWLALHDAAEFVHAPNRLQWWLLFRAAAAVSYPDEAPHHDAAERPF